MYCFDTNILIDILRGDESLKSKLSKLDNSNVFITPVTLCELYKGAYLFHDPSEKVKILEAFISLFKPLKFDKESCKEFGKEFARLKKSGKTSTA